MLRGAKTSLANLLLIVASIGEGARARMVRGRLALIWKEKFRVRFRAG